MAGIERYFTRHLDQREKQALTTALGKVLSAHQPPLVVPRRR